MMIIRRDIKSKFYSCIRLTCSSPLTPITSSFHQGFLLMLQREQDDDDDGHHLVEYIGTELELDRHSTVTVTTTGTLVT